MQKLSSLKEHLLASIQNLTTKQLHVFADDGGIAGTLNGSLSFSYQYKATIIIENLSANADAVFVPLLFWCQHNQTDLDIKDIRFIADPLDNENVDLRIELPLTEAVIVSINNDGNYITEHIIEPKPIPSENTANNKVTKEVSPLSVSFANTGNCVK